MNKKSMNIMEESRKILNRLYKADRKAGTMHDYKVSIHLSPNPLNYDGVDSCSIEIHEYKEAWGNEPPFTRKVLFDHIIGEYRDGITVEECFKQISSKKEELARVMAAAAPRYVRPDYLNVEEQK
jgi:hypothetical protein